MVKGLPAAIGVRGRRVRWILLGEFELQQSDVGGGAVRRDRLHVEGRMGGDLAHVPQLWLAIRAVVDDLVGCARPDAMGHRQNQIGRDQGAGAEIAARADDGHDGLSNAFDGWRGTADDGVGGRRQ